VTIDKDGYTPDGPSREKVWRMFDRIAGRYDLLNRLLSFRQDVRWRKKLVQHFPSAKNLQMLDLATGTADVLLSLFKQSENLERGVGIDMAREMLKVGRGKVHKEQKDNQIVLYPADAMHLPFRDNSFHLVTIAFGIRNVLDLNKGLGEMNQVLKKGGRLLVLEFSLPSSRWFRKIYLFYFRKILPVIGGIISGDMYAYNYLNQTVETFPYGEEFCNLMLEAGFSKVKFVPLTFGIASIYIGDKK
jgi:demethylmenaquinone methyltransferase/2-methoxy-6-polyprenyl-1,4-benzoquinol methylase